MANYSNVCLRVAKMIDKKGKEIKDIDETLQELLIKTCAEGEGYSMVDNDVTLFYLSGRWTYETAVSYNYLQPVYAHAYSIGIRQLILRYVETEEGCQFAASGEIDCTLRENDARVTLSVATWDVEAFYAFHTNKSFPDMDDYEDEEDAYYDANDECWSEVSFHLDEKEFRSPTVPATRVTIETYAYA